MSYNRSPLTTPTTVMYIKKCGKWHGACQSVNVEHPVNSHSYMQIVHFICHAQSTDTADGVVYHASKGPYHAISMLVYYDIYELSVLNFRIANIKFVFQENVRFLANIFKWLLLYCQFWY
jgi:hypothetical protein